MGVIEEDCTRTRLKRTAKWMDAMFLSSRPSPDLQSLDKLLPRAISSGALRRTLIVFGYQQQVPRPTGAR